MPAYKETHTVFLEMVSAGIVCLHTMVHPKEGGGGGSKFQLTGMIGWGQKSKPKKIPRASNKTQKNPWTRNYPEKIPCRISEP